MHTMHRMRHAPLASLSRSLRVPLLAPLPLLPFLLLLLVPCAPEGEAAPVACPSSMTCDAPVTGFFNEHPQHGRLRVGFTGLGPNQPESCSRLCRSTKGCAFWMYHTLRPDGQCTMWSHRQSPCAAQDPNNPSSTLFDSQSLASTLVGGPCIEPTDGTTSVDTAEPTAASLRRSRCPRLLCHSPHAGFLYDHPSRGHLLSLVTGRRRKPYTCFQQCKETPGCAFWMFNMKSDLGECKLWSEAQSPCKPEPGSDDPNTAHFDPKPAQGSYVVGGYCRTPKSADEDVID